LNYLANKLQNITDAQHVCHNDLVQQTITLSLQQIKCRLL